MTDNKVKTAAKSGKWSDVPFDWGMKYFMKRDETSKAIKFFQFKTGKSVFDRDSWNQWRQMQRMYC